MDREPDQGAWNAIANSLWEEGLLIDSLPTRIFASTSDADVNNIRALGLNVLKRLQSTYNESIDPQKNPHSFIGRTSSMKTALDHLEAATKLNDIPLQIMLASYVKGFCLRFDQCYNEEDLEDWKKTLHRAGVAMAAVLAQGSMNDGPLREEMQIIKAQVDNLLLIYVTELGEPARKLASYFDKNSRSAHWEGTVHGTMYTLSLLGEIDAPFTISNSVPRLTEKLFRKNIWRLHRLHQELPTYADASRDKSECAARCQEISDIVCAHRARYSGLAPTIFLSICDTIIEILKHSDDVKPEAQLKAGIELSSSLLHLMMPTHGGDIGAEDLSPEATRIIDSHKPLRKAIPTETQKKLMRPYSTPTTRGKRRVDEHPDDCLILDMIEDLNDQIFSLPEEVSSDDLMTVIDSYNENKVPVTRPEFLGKALPIFARAQHRFRHFVREHSGKLSKSCDGDQSQDSFNEFTDEWKKFSRRFSSQIDNAAGLPQPGISEDWLINSTPVDAGDFHGDWAKSIAMLPKGISSGAGGGSAASIGTPDAPDEDEVMEDEEEEIEDEEEEIEDEEEEMEDEEEEMEDEEEEMEDEEEEMEDDDEEATDTSDHEQFDSDKQNDEAALQPLTRSHKRNISRILRDKTCKSLVAYTNALIDKGLYRQLKLTLRTIMNADCASGNLLLVYLSSALLALLGCLRINTAETTQTELDHGELAVRGDSYAMLQLQAHALKVLGLLQIGDDIKIPHGRITLTDVAKIDPLEKSPQVATKLRDEVQSRLAQEYVKRLSDDTTFAAHEEAIQPQKVKQMRSIVEFLCKKPTAFDKAGFDLYNPAKGQNNYAVTLIRVTKSVIDHDGGDVKLWLDSCASAMEAIARNKAGCRHTITFIHRSIAINASARLAEKLQEEGKDTKVWNIKPEEKANKLHAMYEVCRRVMRMMHSPDQKDKLVNVPSNQILLCRLAAVVKAYMDLGKTLSNTEEEQDVGE